MGSNLTDAMKLSKDSSFSPEHWAKHFFLGWNIAQNYVLTLFSAKNFFVITVRLLYVLFVAGILMISA